MKHSQGNRDNNMQNTTQKYKSRQHHWMNTASLYETTLGILINIIKESKDAR